MELKERDIAGLEAKLGQLEQVKDRQAGQIESLRRTGCEQLAQDRQARQIESLRGTECKQLAQDRQAGQIESLRRTKCEQLAEDRRAGQIESLRRTECEQLAEDRQAGQLESLRQSRVELDERSGEATTTIRHLTDELNKLKFTLDDVTRRQKQVPSPASTVLLSDTRDGCLNSVAMDIDRSTGRPSGRRYESSADNYFFACIMSKFYLVVFSGSYVLSQWIHVKYFVP